MTTKINYNDLIGLPFVDGGTGLTGEKPGGFDCYGLTREVYKRNGVNIPQTNISVTACCQMSQKEIEEHIQKSWLKLDKPEPLCAVQIYSSMPEYANHIATYLGFGKIIHISMKTNVIIQRLADYNPAKIEGYYRYVGPSL